MCKTKHEKNRNTISRAILLMAAMAISLILAGGIIPAKVQAGDTSYPLLWICFAVISAGVASAIIIRKKKQREDM